MDGKLGAEYVNTEGTTMIRCTLCRNNLAANQIGLCASCIRTMHNTDRLISLHAAARKSWGLPGTPPQSIGGKQCQLCVNACSMGEGQSGYCGLRINQEGRIEPLVPERSALVYAYLDPLPTNCCATWFCPGSHEPGYNLAVFFYGCNFDCLFCQNASHKLVRMAPVITEKELLARACAPSIRCICFFGGSPEPQLPFALRVAQQIQRESEGVQHICWEWNGAGNPLLVERAARISLQTGGVVKFDLKAIHPNLHMALCGTGNQRTLENFYKVANITRGTDTLTATTLLVPHYIDAQEVGAIARFIAGINNDIPYSLLVFHPDYLLTDLPITPQVQVDECVTAARQHLHRVNIGNIHLLS
ncbi:MAG: radical SAM protein [Methanomicrobiales archaeon]|nr:radical SAM protein [Methanomicrobiales archaeon]